MKNKNEIVRNILLKIKQIVDVHLSIEEQPLHFTTDIILTPKEIRTIQAIGKSSRINIKQLGDYFSTSKSAASQIISKLVNKGFVQKDKSLDNNKEYKLYLTKSGQKAFATYQNFHNSHLTYLHQALSSTFSKNELEKSYELLKLLEEKMEEKINQID